ncbi:MAG: phosphatidate cytidylyltransferase [Frankiaceae bacterium]
MTGVRIRRRPSAESNAPGKGSGGAPGRAGRDLRAAIGVGVGIAVLVIGTLYTVRVLFVGVVALAVVLGLYELSVALRSKGIVAPYLPMAVGGAAVCVFSWVLGARGLWIAAGAMIVGVGLVVLLVRRRGAWRDIAAIAAVTAYVPMLAGCVVLLARPPDGADRVISFAVTTACSDIGAYAVGVLFGKHFLAPKISPKKTWEGFGGSLGACMIAGVVLLPGLFGAAVWQGVAFGLAVAVTATSGDLAESMLKRRLGVKDMGTLLPGHGGVMDRADSLLPSALVSLGLLLAFAPPG